MQIKGNERVTVKEKRNEIKLLFEGYINAVWFKGIVRKTLQL